MSRRRYKRYTRRLEVEFSAGEYTFKGISSNISERGLFIRTQKGFVPGTRIEMKLRLPDGSVSNLKGIVRRTIKTRHSFIKNGMGVEITEHDPLFEGFVRQELTGQTGERTGTVKNSATEASGDPGGTNKDREYVILKCPSCSVNNRVPTAYLSKSLKCGKCGASLT